MSACRVCDIGSLGHGSMQRLMKLHSRHPVASSASSIASLAALTCTDVTPAGRDTVMSINKATQQLQAAPQLVDLGEWTQWAVACAPTLGALSIFLSQHGMHYASCALMTLCLQIPAGMPLQAIYRCNRCNCISCVARVSLI